MQFFMNDNIIKSLTVHIIHTAGSKEVIRRESPAILIPREYCEYT